MQLRSVRIERFKRLASVNFNVSDVNILVGGNNSGKSTVIQAVHFAFTLFQSLAIANKWPVKNKKTSTVGLPGRRIQLHFIPAYCPHLNPIERLWGVMHKSLTANSITDNFRIIRPANFRILA